DRPKRLRVEALGDPHGRAVREHDVDWGRRSGREGLRGDHAHGQEGWWHPVRRTRWLIPRNRDGSLIAPGQLLPPPAEGPVLQPLSLAEVADRESAALLASDRPPPEPFLGGVASFAAALGHGGVSPVP